MARRATAKTVKIPASLCWFDVPTDDIQRAKKFYRALFGWKFGKFPAAVEDYWHIETGGPDASPDGGLMPRMHPGHTITIYITVPNLDRAVANCRNSAERLGNRKWPSLEWGTSPFAKTRSRTLLHCGR